MCHLQSRARAGRYADRGEPAWSPAELYPRIARRRGKEHVTLAVAHALLVILFQRLRDQKPSPDLDADSFDPLDTSGLQHGSVQRLEQLGYTVALTPVPAA